MSIVDHHYYETGDGRVIHSVEPIDGLKDIGEAEFRERIRVKSLVYTNLERWPGCHLHVGVYKIDAECESWRQRKGHGCDPLIGESGVWVDAECNPDPPEYRMSD